MIIERKLYLSKLTERMHNRLIKIVTGIRRSGKSFLLNELFVTYLLENGVDSDHILRISLEGVEGKPFRDAEYAYQTIINHMADNKMYYIILDEVQMMDDFIEVLNGLLQIKNADVYVKE